MPAKRAKPPVVAEQSAVRKLNLHCLESGLARCVNCRREIEASLSRIAGRKQRQARVLEECSIDRCVAFLRGVKEEAMRLHLASMAWWRLSAGDGRAAEPIRTLMLNARAELPDSGAAYTHRVLRVLQPLSRTQLSAWFGCENLYQLVHAFADTVPPEVGSHCGKCGLYRHGCTEYGMLTANKCRLWKDETIQRIARTWQK